MRRASLPLLSLSLLASPLLAGEFNRNLIPSEAQWVAHFDVEGLQRTELFKAIEGLAAEREDFDLDFEGEEFQELRDRFGIDPKRDLKSVTLFATNTKGDEPTILLTTTNAVDIALAELKLEENYRSLEHSGLALHGISDSHSSDIDGAFYVHKVGEERLIVASEDPGRVVQAVRVLTGEASTLARSSVANLRAEPAAGAFIFVEIGPGLSQWADFEPASEVAGLAQRGVVNVGERSGSFFIDVEVETSNPEDASNISSVVQGARALGTLALNNGEAPGVLVDFLNAVQIDTQGSLVRLGFEYFTRDLIEDALELENY